MAGARAIVTRSARVCAWQRITQRRVVAGAARACVAVAPCTDHRRTPTPVTGQHRQCCSHAASTRRTGCIVADRGGRAVTGPQWRFAHGPMWRAPRLAGAEHGTRALHTLPCVYAADATAVGSGGEEEERREDISEDTLVFAASNTWKFRSLGGVGFVKALVWSYLGYTCYFYPDVVAGMSPWWSLVGLGMSTAMLLSAQSLAANTVKEIVRTQGGMMARITTFNVFGGANAPAEFKIEHLTSKDMGKGYDHIRVGTAKSFLLCDQKGHIPNRGAYNNLINGRTILNSSARHNIRWLEARDPQSGKTYWYHPLTRQTSWLPPRGHQG